MCLISLMCPLSQVPLTSYLWRFPVRSLDHRNRIGIEESVQFPIGNELYSMNLIAAPLVAKISISVLYG